MQLSRSDFLQVGATQRGALALLSQQGTSNVVVADQNGDVTCFAPANASHMLWTQKVRSCSRLELTTKQWTLEPADTLLVAGGSNIYSFSSAGAEMGTLETNVAEAIKSLKSDGPSVWIGAKYIYSQYQSGREKHFAILDNKVHDLILSRITAQMEMNAVLACHDRCIRLMQEDAPLYLCQTSGAPSVLLNYVNFPRSFDYTSQVLYGTLNGHIGCVELDKTEGRVLWNLEESKAAVTCLALGDLAGTGLNQIVLGREDGSLEVHGVDSASGEMLLQASYAVGETITGVKTGTPRSPGLSEIVVSTHSGKILSLCDPEKAQIHRGASQIEVLQTEIIHLESQLQAARGKLAIESGREEMTAAQSSLQVIHNLSTLVEEAAHVLSLESTVPFELIMLTTTVPIEIIEEEDAAAAMSQTSDGVQICAVYRFAEATSTRAQVKFRMSEGHGGSITCYVVPMTTPKIGHLVTITIYPLSMHEKISQITSPPSNSLHVRGNFSQAEIQGWMTRLVSEFPPHVTNCCFASAVVGTVLEVSLGNGQAEFKSDSISTLMIIKESLAEQAAARRQELQAYLDVKEDSYTPVLQLIDTKMKDLHEQATKTQLLDALKEIDIQGDLTCFSTEWKEVLEKSETLKKREKQVAAKLRFLQGLVSDLFVDWARHKGVANIAPKMHQLQQVLGGYSLEGLLQLFSEL